MEEPDWLVSEMLWMRLGELNQRARKAMRMRMQETDQQM